jgi:hypothetical protein
MVNLGGMVHVVELPVLLNMIRSVSPLHVPYHLGSPCPSPHVQSTSVVKRGEPRWYGTCSGETDLIMINNTGRLNMR